jgi:DNA-binding response OmpR family regulator
MRLLFVEDDPDIADAVRRNLERSGFAVDLAMDLADATASVESQRYDLVLLDLGLPDGDGLELVRRLRRRRDPVPVLILTARDAVPDRVAGLEASADDYLVKPFAHEELLARIRALLRRPAQHLGERIEVGNLAFDPGSGTFTVDGEPFGLPRRERALLEALVRRAGRVVQRSALEDALWGFEEEIESNTLGSHVSRLRKRLAGAGARVEIRTFRGLGYMLRALPS